MTDWPGFFFDGKNRANTSETTLNDNWGDPVALTSPDANNVTNLVVKWKYDTGGAVRSYPVCSGSYVIIGSQGGKWYSLAQSDGTKRWERNLSAQINCTAYADGTTVYAGCDDGKMRGLDETNGTISWTFDTGRGSAAAITGSPNVTGGNVLFGTLDGYTYSVPTTGGSANWTRSPVGSGEVAQAVAITASGAVICQGNSAYLISLVDGTTIQDFPTGNQITAPPMIATDTNSVQHLIIGSTDHVLYDYDLDTGHLIWWDHQGGDILSGTPIDTVNGYAAAGTHNWGVEMHNLFTGKLRWRKDGGTGGGIHGAAFTSHHAMLPNATVNRDGEAPTGLMFAAYAGDDNCLRCFDVVHQPGGQASIWKYPSAVGGTWEGQSGRTNLTVGPTVCNAKVFQGVDGHLDNQGDPDGTLGYLYCFGI